MRPSSADAIMIDENSKWEKLLCNNLSLRCDLVLSCLFGSAPRSRLTEQLRKGEERRGRGKGGNAIILFPSYISSLFRAFH